MRAVTQPLPACRARRRRSRARAGLALGTLVICVALVMGMALFVLREIEATFETERTALGLTNTLQLREVKGRVDTVLSEAARHYDMLIVGNHAETDDEHVTLPDALEYDSEDLPMRIVY